jgi:hypothetical protein
MWCRPAAGITTTIITITTIIMGTTIVTDRGLMM